MAIIKRLTGGRAWAARLSVLVAVGALVGLIVAIVPALAGHSGTPIPPPSGVHGLTPIEVDLGGQPDDCSATEVGLGHLWDFRIEDPSTGTFIDTQSGFTVTFNLTVYKVAGEEFVDWSVIGASVEGVIIKGGTNSAFYHYVPKVSNDDAAHATLKSNGKLHQASHTSFCYDIVGTISGTKFHDNDTDGEQDPSQEFGESGWTITAFDEDGISVGSDTTDVNGDYTIENVSLGQTYTVCEATNTSGLPDPGTNFTWAWSQSDLKAAIYPTWGSTDCFDAGLAGQEAGGHEFLMNSSVSDIDFGNHTEATFNCLLADVTVVLSGAPDEPVATITIPGGCNSVTFTSSFDIGTSDDADTWDQFVVFGGDPTAAGETILETVAWAAEDAVYSGGVLQVPTTLVQLSPGGALVNVVSCGPGEPFWNTVPHCLRDRTIIEEAATAAWVTTPTQLRITENYEFIGDPPKFR